MGKISSLLLLILISAVLISTNPTKEQYVEWATGQLSSTVQKEQDSLERLILGWGIKTFAPGVIRENTSERDYYLFSLYTTRVGDQSFTAIGLLNHFMFIESANGSAASWTKAGTGNDYSSPYLQFIYDQVGRWCSAESR